MSNEQIKTPELTFEQVQQLAANFTRLTELREQTIQTPTSAAEAKGLVEHLAQELLVHASEFIGSWMVAHLEYEPLINSFSNVVNRANARIAQHQARRAAAIAAATKTEDSAASGKIITLK